MGVLRVEIYSPRLSPRILTFSLNIFPSPASMVQLPPPYVPCGTHELAALRIQAYLTLVPDVQPSLPSLPSKLLSLNINLSTLTVEIFFLASTSGKRAIAELCYHIHGKPHLGGLCLY